MRLFGATEDGSLVQYSEQAFKRENQEADLESWLETNPDCILEDSRMLLIGRQVTTNLGSVIDLLGLDSSGDLVVAELKRERTPRESLAQVLEYASFAEGLSYDQLQDILRQYQGDESITLESYHRTHFGLAPSDAVSYNKRQRLVILAESVTREIAQTARFLARRGVPIQCIEFRFFRTQSGDRVLSSDCVVGADDAAGARSTAVPRARLTSEQFLAVCDDAGRRVFGRLLGFAEQNGFPIHWGSAGFSLNVDVEGNHTNLLLGYSPQSVYKQHILTSFAEIARKIQDADAVVARFREGLEGFGHARPAGSELKWRIGSGVADAQVEALLQAVRSVAAMAKERGLKE